MSNNHEPPAWKPPCEMIPTSEQHKNKTSERLQRGNWPEENSIWLLNSSSVSRKVVGDGFKVWGSSISPKLPIKCEGRMVKFCLYKLSKHYSHKTFLRNLLEEAVHQNRRKPRDSTRGSQRGAQDPKITRWRGSVHTGEHMNLYKEQGEPPWAQSLLMMRNQTLNKGKTWQLFIPSKTKCCTR